jgi:hypothetical protein
MKLHKIHIRPKPGTEGNIMTGQNTEVLFDGKPLIGPISIKFEVSSRSVAKVRIEMVVEVEIEGNVARELTPAQKAEVNAEKWKQRAEQNREFNKQMCELGFCGHIDEAHTKYDFSDKEYDED